MHKLLKICCLTATLFSTSLTGAIHYVSGDANLVAVKADDGVSGLYTLTLNKSVTDSTSFESVTYEYNKHAIIEFSSVKSGGGVGTIAANSTVIKTSASYGLSNIQVNYSKGTLILESWYIEDEIVKNYYPLTSGKTTFIRGNYWKLYSEDSEVTIDKIILTYGCLNKEDRPDTSNATLTVDKDSGAFMYETIDGVIWGVTGTYKEYIPEQIEIYNGNTILPIDEILLTQNNRFTIRCNLTKHYGETSGLSFIPHLRYNSKDYGVINSTYQVDNQTIGGRAFIDKINVRYCTWYLDNKDIPCFSIQVRPVFEFNGTVAKTSHRLDTKRVDAGNGDFFYPYIIRLVQSNPLYNFDPKKDYGSILFWDFIEPDVHSVLPYKAEVVEVVTTEDGRRYEVIDFYMNMIDIFRSKINGNNNFRGDKKDTFCFHFTINHAKEGNKIITNSQYDYVDQRVVLDSTIGKTGHWGGWPHSEAEDTRNDFYIATKGQYKAGCPIMLEMPAFGMYEKMGG